jgi:hypothetical protein
MSFNEFPPLLTPKHIQQILNNGRTQSYALMNSGEFHVIRVGKRLYVLKEVFLEWLRGSKDQED